MSRTAILQTYFNFTEFRGLLHKTSKEQYLLSNEIFTPLNDTPEVQICFQAVTGEKKNPFFTAIHAYPLSTPTAV